MANRFELLTLNNGVKIWHLQKRPNSLEPFYRIQVGFDFGSRDVPETELGLAHFLEHQIFNVGELDSWQMGELFRNNGGFLNAHTSADRISIEAEISAKKSSLLLPKLVGMIREPVLGRNLEREKGVVRREFEERNRTLEMCRREDEVGAQCFPPFFAKIHSQTTALGTPETMAAYTEERLDYYWRQRFRKCLSHVVIAGEFDLEQVAEQFATLELQAAFKRPLYTGNWPDGAVHSFDFCGEKVIYPRQDNAFATTLFPCTDWQRLHRLIIQLGIRTCHDRNCRQARECEGLAYSANHSWSKSLDHILIGWTIPGDPTRLDRLREILKSNIFSLPSLEDFETKRETRLISLLHEENDTADLCRHAVGDLEVVGHITNPETVSNDIENITYEQFADFWQKRVIEGSWMLAINSAKS